MARPKSDEKRARVDLRMDPAILARLDETLPLSEHATRTAFIEAAIEMYAAALERTPIEAAMARALALPRHEVEYLPLHYMEANLDAGAFKAWLTETAPRPGNDWTPKQLANRHEINPQADFSDRFQVDERLPTVATKREYLVLMQRGGYSSDDRYWFDQLWRQFLKSGKAFLYTQK